MKNFATKPQQMKRSGIREILEIAVRTPGCIRLEVGEPNFPTPPHIIEAAAQAARDGYTKYALTAGVLPLREALLQKLRTFNSMLDVAMENILVTTGASFALMAAFEALIDPGDEVLVPDPGWPTYSVQLQLIGGVPKVYPAYVENNFIPKIEDIEAQITERTKVLVLCNPSNPTGAVYPSETVREMLALATKYDLYVISDEVYEHLIFEGTPTTASLFDPERTIGIYSFSKSYSMTGWRVGYAVTAQPLLTLMSRVLEPNMSCVAMPNQMAAVAALTGPQDAINTMRSAYQHRRDLVCDLLKQRGLYQYSPAGAFYLMVDISSTKQDSYAFAKAFLNDKKVSVAPGGTFGPSSANYVRISLATAEADLVEGVTRLCDYVTANSLQTTHA
jgi:aspartate aminotransferase/aminotransferase